MEDSKTSGAKSALSTMLYYYLSSLIGVVDNPKQHIASEIGEMLDLSEDQMLYVQNYINSDCKFIENINSCILLLDNMIDSKQLDLESISIVKNVLTLILNQTKNIINTLELGDENNVQ